MHMAAEPAIKRAIVFIDGQNLFHCVRNAFGYTFPNFDIKGLATRVCATKAWQLDSVRFYTGVPDATDNAFWSQFWAAKLLAMSRQGVVTYSRPLRYRNKRVRLPDGSVHAYLSGEEKGIDVRIALDVIALAHRRVYDVALIVSQDQDLSEVAEEVRVIANEQGRWIKVASAYPSSPAAANRRGINKTDWIPIDRATYDACIDPYDYRPKANPAP
jgi:uncharacterized LabA/DUF88 family protein